LGVSIILQRFATGLLMRMRDGEATLVVAVV